MLLQFWDCLFKVTVVDCVIRLMGFTGKGIVLLTHASQPEECFRRRAQVCRPSHTTQACCRKSPSSGCVFCKRWRMAAHDQLLMCACKCEVASSCSASEVFLRSAVANLVLRGWLPFQVLSFTEQMLLIYRTIVTIPCWLAVLRGHWHGVAAHVLHERWTPVRCLPATLAPYRVSWTCCILIDTAQQAC